MKKKFIVICAIVVFLAFSVTFLLMNTEGSSLSEPKDHPSYREDTAITESNTVSLSSISLSAVGDILIHDRVYENAETKNGYDFMPMLEAVQSEMEQADITFANQETVIGGTAIGLSSYPSFNSPQEVGDALKETGVDIVSMANNHTLDRGEKALQNAIEHWKEIGMLYTGSYLSEEDQSKIRTIKKDDITVAFLAYTYGTNGIRPPANKPYLVNYIDKEKISKDIQDAKSISDAVVVSMHFGNEYERLPSNFQLDLSSFIAESGADIILGHHPHVLQPVEWINTTDGRNVFVAYSLGNFLSGQKFDYKDIGGILTLTIEKKNFRGETTVDVTSPAFFPTFVEKGYIVKPLNEAKPELLNEINEHMSQWVPELKVPKQN
ncbi:CapA family protein [Guptibacillus algicola]|uniref:CapA family protein n=1 Tax=Guptibacillus algicola TaxID=225844 RepID=UPI001CD4AF28|nr:CapA family protein [Alkalihalobacillus algicola]MCA0986475.1 CapA family protein [Alkalihalobacillus algicola]